MKAVILAGGYGTRISEESVVRPKPMVEIGGMPIIWHIMKIYSAHGINEFVVCAGYKGHMLKEYFANYFLHRSDVTFELVGNRMTAHRSEVEPWSVTIVDTGDGTMTGGRLKRARSYIGEETFCMTYGDCLAAIDVTALVEFHRAANAVVTLTAIQPPGRFGSLVLTHESDRIERFHEKPDGEGGWVNGGFFVIEPDALDAIAADDTVWELEPLETLAKEGKVAAYRHGGYWQNMDSLRDKMVLEEQWASGAPGWKLW
jgi:glucose-1-phosphate cytidylyltransferase